MSYTTPTVVLLLLCQFTSCQAQPEDPTVMLSEDFDADMPFYYGMPEQLTATDTSAGWALSGQKMLLTGTIYQRDGKTPASNVMLYYYQTDTNGEYIHQTDQPRSMPPNAQGQTHGYIRGWVRTDASGKYAIYTVRPGSYPNRAAPAHIHLTVKDPLVEEPYYIDDAFFDDDRLLTTEIRTTLQNRGGSGILRLVQQGDVHIGERDIILGLHIPGYPKGSEPDIDSGKAIGENIHSFTPIHAWGPDAGTKTCPICKYGWYHGVLYFVGEDPDWDNVKEWLRFLEAESKRRDGYLKVYFVYGKEENYSKANRTEALAKLGKELQLEKLALTFVPSFNDRVSEIYLNDINPEVANTFLIYRRSNIVDKFINLNPTPENFALLTQRLDATTGEYFKLPRIKTEK